MPTYQYACTECGEQLEVQQRFTDDPLSTCPACQGRLRKVFNAVGVVFKGSGFYRTDSRAKPAEGGGGKDAKPAAVKADTGAAANGKPAESSPAGAAKVATGAAKEKTPAN